VEPIHSSNVLYRILNCLINFRNLQDNDLLFNWICETDSRTWWFGFSIIPSV